MESLYSSPSNLNLGPAGRFSITSISSGSTTVSLEFSSCATFFMTSTAGEGLSVTEGMPCLMIPAFSKAIFSMVSPRKAVCSMLMLLMTATSGTMTLVASKRPPMPTSTTAKSTPMVRK